MRIHFNKNFIGLTINDNTVHKIIFQTDDEKPTSIFQQTSPDERPLSPAEIATDLAAIKSAITQAATTPIGIQYIPIINRLEKSFAGPKETTSIPAYQLG